MGRGRRRQPVNVNHNGGNPSQELERPENVPRQEEPTMAIRPRASRVGQVSRAMSDTDRGSRGYPQQALYEDISSQEGAFSFT